MLKLCPPLQPPAQQHYSVPFIHSEFNRLAYYDPLTMLPNRGMLQDLLGLTLVTNKHTGMLGALCFVNVNDFSRFNSAEGHDTGDQLLIQLATRLCNAVGNRGVVSRQWGDEFLILLQNLGSTAVEATHNATVMGQRLRSALHIPLNLGMLSYACSIRIGICLFRPEDTVELIFTHAALALQQATKTEASSLCFFDPAMQLQNEQRSALLAELAKALSWKQFRIYYQPQVDHLQCLVGVEALLRWQHPLRGMVPPDEFIPLTEESDLILSIGLWVLRSVCTQLKLWEKLPRFSKLQLSVNVSVRQFQQATFVSEVESALADSGADPALLKLELTESLVLENLDNVIEKMQKIRQLGVRFSMDDFGTGYSSLSHLAFLPFDQLKIDRSFVQNIPGKSSDEIVVRTIIAMGRGLGMEVIAEGVETEAQRLFLACNGCNAYQGYLFGRPLTLEALESLVGG